MFESNYMNTKIKSRSKQKREAIVTAAKRAFQEHGVQATSMDRLAELAQVSKRTVYNHFATKEELVLHLLSELWARSMIQADVVYEPEKSLEDQLRRLVEAEIELVSGPEFLGLARVAAGYFLYQPEKLREEIARLSAQETALHRWLKSAMEDGRLKAMDIELAVTQVHNLVKGSCYWPQLLGYAPDLGADEKRRVAQETVSLFLSHYRT